MVRMEQEKERAGGVRRNEGRVNERRRGIACLLLVDELELVDEVVEVLEAGVEVRLLAQGHDLVEVRVVDVGVDAEEALEDRLDDFLEGLGEGNVDAGGEDGLVVELGLDPGHEEVHVLGQR